jgi:hypothetical protein
MLTKLLKGIINRLNTVSIKIIILVNDSRGYCNGKKAQAEIFPRVINNSASSPPWLRTAVRHLRIAVLSPTANLNDGTMHETQIIVNYDALSNNPRTQS